MQELIINKTQIIFVAEIIANNIDDNIIIISAKEYSFKK
jgi:hypothetical protein